MAEPISTALTVTAINLGGKFAEGFVEEMGKHAADYVAQELPKWTEEGWERHDAANEALGTGLSAKRLSQA